MKYVVFDFNGTILDDTVVGWMAEKKCMEHFEPDKKPITLDEYKRLFTFPVKDYYTKVGFNWDKYTYEEVSEYWFKWYCAYKDQYKVHDGVIDLLNRNRQAGIKNIILSASSLVEMKKQLKELEIEEYFDEVLGIDNILAGSKVDIALNWIKDKDPKECVMLGDTLHDLEVSRVMGIDCILIANGHQAKEVLTEKYDKVVDDIRQVEL